MSDLLVDPGLVIALVLNFYILTVTSLKQVIYAVALQGALLGLLYPMAHTGFLPDSGSPVRADGSGCRDQGLGDSAVPVARGAGCGCSIAGDIDGRRCPSFAHRGRRNGSCGHICA